MEKEKKTLWKGIKAVFSTVVDWFATLFGMKDNSKYGRILHRIVGTAFALVVVLWAITVLVHFGQSVFFRNYHRSCGVSHRNVYLDETFNDNLFYYAARWSDQGYLADSNGRKVLKHILCINKPLEGDSLVHFSDGDKRGYFHMRDGRLVVKPIYEHAWVFSNGLAAVEEKGRIKFIDTAGKVVIDRGFAYNYEDDGYVFHDGHCAVNDSTGRHMGLIGRDGNWVLPPVYKYIYPIDTFWLVKTDDRQAILTFAMDTVIPLSNVKLDFCDTAIHATFADHTQGTYNLQGKLIGKNEIRNIEQLVYKTHEIIYKQECNYDEEDEDNYFYSDYMMRSAVATCFQYEAESGWFGLLSPDGRMLTPPSYRSIEAVDKDLYLCTAEHGHGVLINSRGQRVE